MTAVGYDSGTSFGAPPPVRRRMGISTIVLAAGTISMGVSLVLIIAGVPASTYDPNGPAHRNVNHSHDMLQMTKSLDGNMKYIKEQTGDGPNQFNGLQTAINSSEDNIASIGNSVGHLTASVEAIDSSLNSVGHTTKQMRVGMTQLSTVSSQSAMTMGSLNSNVTTIAGSMVTLSSATGVLTKSVNGIERRVGIIANKRTQTAKQLAHALNATLPNEVPTPQTSLAAERTTP